MVAGQSFPDVFATFKRSGAAWWLLVSKLILPDPVARPVGLRRTIASEFGREMEEWIVTVMPVKYAGLLCTSS